MKSSLLGTLTLLLLGLAQPSYADSIPTFTTQANIGFIRGSSGDNQGAFFQASGVSLNASGDASCSWCGFGDFFLTPGSSLNPSIQNEGIDWVAVYGSVRIGAQGYGCGGDNCSLFGTGLTSLRSFTFPTDGRNFTVTVPAVINGPITGELGTGLLFNLRIPTGELVLTFDFVRGQNGFPSYYEFSRGAFTTSGFQAAPEPGTLGLMASGLAGILGLGLRTGNRKRLPN